MNLNPFLVLCKKKSSFDNINDSLSSFVNELSPELIDLEKKIDYKAGLIFLSRPILSYLCPPMALYRGKMILLSSAKISFVKDDKDGVTCTIRAFMGVFPLLAMLFVVLLIWSLSAGRIEFVVSSVLFLSLILLGGMVTSRFIYPDVFKKYIL